MQTLPSQKSSEGSGEQSINSQDLSKIPPRFGYRTALLGVRNYLIIQVVVVHGMRITKIMRMSSIVQRFKKTPKFSLNIINNVKINLKVNNVI